MTPLVARLIAAAALVSVPAALSAHRMWMLPSGTVFSDTSGWVTVDAAVSNDLFFFDHQPLRLDGVKVWQPDGSEGVLQNGATGRYRSVFDVRLDKPGTWKIGTQMNAVMGSFKVDGVEKRLGRRGPPQPGAPAPLTVADIPANATDVKLAETSTRNEIFVTAGAPTTTVFRPTGKGLEFAPVTHPDELVAGETATFRFLVDGKPAPGLKVTVIPGGKRYRNDEGARELSTGADGVLSVTWPAAGMYWLNATLTDAKATTPRATERRMSYVTTLEVLTP
ncbi:DUF4198 domain-containing protein [Sphingomonas sp. Leaf20]|uniref:DUF4198 domain-containing protein n=1 Tax=Sphingomonas sp. Leaf20 TaxID=1735685 RepID=UPI0006F76192|nr:DUF4198 domain-containing protein [Sphingomonas sp. Leaf20]KQM69960.1 nickel uptake transporter family protein [Sphingomonas sp. Leaf20]